MRSDNGDAVDVEGPDQFLVGAVGGGAGVRRWTTTNGGGGGAAGADEEDDVGNPLVAPTVVVPRRRARQEEAVSGRVAEELCGGEDVVESDTESCSDSEDVVDPAGGGPDEDDWVQQPIGCELKSLTPSVNVDAGKSRSVKPVSVRSSWRWRWRLMGARVGCI